MVSCYLNQCEDGYEYINGACYSSDSCPIGYSDNCIPCSDDNCRICAFDETECDFCVPGFYQYEGDCVP